MATQIDWSWDERDGQLLKRFNRSLASEAWLVGLERGDGDRHVNEGRTIRDIVARTSRRATLILCPFVIDPRRVDSNGHLRLSEGANMRLTFEDTLRACLPGDGSFPRKDALAWLRSLAPSPDDTFVLVQKPVAPVTIYSAYALLEG